MRLVLAALLAYSGTLNYAFGDTDEKQVDRMYLEMLSCETLESLGERLALEVIHDDEELAKPRCKFMRKVDPICRAYSQLRAEHMQSLTDVDDEGRRRCGWDRN